MVSIEWKPIFSFEGRKYSPSAASVTNDVDGERCVKLDPWCHGLICFVTGCTREHLRTQEGSVSIARHASYKTLVDARNAAQASEFAPDPETDGLARLFNRDGHAPKQDKPKRKKNLPLIRGSTTS